MSHPGSNQVRRQPDTMTVLAVRSLLLTPCRRRSPQNRKVKIEGRDTRELKSQCCQRNVGSPTTYIALQLKARSYRQVHGVFVTDPHFSSFSVPHSLAGSFIVIMVARPLGLSSSSCLFGHHVDYMLGSLESKSVCPIPKIPGSTIS